MLSLYVSAPCLFSHWSEDGSTDRVNISPGPVDGHLTQVGLGSLRGEQQGPQWPGQNSAWGGEGGPMARPPSPLARQQPAGEWGPAGACSRGCPAQPGWDRGQAARVTSLPAGGESSQVYFFFNMCFSEVCTSFWWLKQMFVNHTDALHHFCKCLPCTTTCNREKNYD